VQEALLRAWERTGPIERLDAWIVTVALNISRSGLRRARAERRARARLSDPPAEVGGDGVDLSRALNRLPHRQREAVVLRYLLENTTAEIAEVMGTTEGTVKSQLFKARAHLAKDLSLDPDEETENADA